MQLSHRTCAALVIGPLLLSGCEKRDPANLRGTVFSGQPWPNVVLISVDMLRPDHLGCYGYGRDTSPNIDRLAAEGTLFENAISTTSWTLPAHAALLTGLNDSVHGCIDTNTRLDSERTTLTERLYEVGYETAGIYSGPYLHPVFGLAQGFEVYTDCTSYPQLSDSTARGIGTVDGPDIWQASHRDVTSPRVYEAARAWLVRQRERPFFLFVHLWDVHYDFVPPPPYDRMFDLDYAGPVTGDKFLFDQWINGRMPADDLDHLVALYDGEIAWTDVHIGRILDDLDELGIQDSTIVVLVADHGTEFFEHGEKSHRKTLFDKVIRIPMIVRYPGGVPAGQRIATQVSIIDVVPTIAELAGLPIPRDVMGASLVPFLEGDTPGWDQPAISELFSNHRRMRSFRWPDRKLIEDLLTGKSWAYDLQTDPGELRPVHSPDDPLMRAARTSAEPGKHRLESVREARGAATASSTVPPQILNQLKSLGFVGSDGEGR